MVDNFISNTTTASPAPFSLAYSLVFHLPHPWSSWQPLICPFFLIFLISKAYISGTNTVYNLFGLAFFPTQRNSLEIHPSCINTSFLFIAEEYCIWSVTAEYDTVCLTVYLLKDIWEDCSLHYCK